jgi:hypothetical protein
MLTLDLFLVVSARASREVSEHPLKEMELFDLVDPRLVQAALEAPFETLGGVPLYPDPAERAAILASRLTRAAQLPDNIELLVALLLVELVLDADGLALSASAAELDVFFRATAEGVIGDDQLIQWMANHTAALRM